jgi:hypothetical protein
MAHLRAHSRRAVGSSCAMGLVPLDEVRRRLRIVGQSYAGVRPVPLERIVGSVDRSADFGPGFRARRSLSRSRLAALRAAFPHGDMPAIEVYEVGGLFFVSDGHHRVALAHERGAEFLDAEFTRLHTNYALPPDVDVGQLVHTEQQRMLLDESGLARSRPDAVIEFARPARLSRTARGHQGARLRPRPPARRPTGARGGRCRLVRQRLSAGSGGRSSCWSPHGLSVQDRGRSLPVGLRASS